MGSEQQTVAFGVVNGTIFNSINFGVYIEIADQIKQVIQVLEYTFETGIRRGMCIQTEVLPHIVQDPLCQQP